MKPLIIEDEGFFAELVAAALGTREAVFAKNLAEGNLVIDQGRTKFIILDLSLPDSSSLDTIEWIRKMKDSARGLTIIVLTGDTSHKTRETALNAGADQYFIKGEQDAALSRIASIGARSQGEPCASKDQVEEIERKVSEMTRRRVAQSQTGEEAPFRMRYLTVLSDALLRT